MRIEHHNLVTNTKITVTRKDEEIYKPIIFDIIKRRTTADESVLSIKRQLQEQQPSKPNMSSDVDKQINQYLMNDFCKRLKFVLSDRLEGGVCKTGRNLQLGSFRKDLFDYFMSAKEGKRTIELFKKGRKRAAYDVYICYKFKGDNAFLNQIPIRLENKEVFTREGIQIQQYRYRYVQLKIMLQHQTDKVHCSWKQVSEKFDGKEWHPSR